MRIVLLLAILSVAACTPLYGRDIANLTVIPDKLPGVGTPIEDLQTWFDKNGYLPGPDVYQSEGELRRYQGAPLVYSDESQRKWWMSRERTLRDFCYTQKFIYYRLDPDQTLYRAIQNQRSVC